MTNLNYALQAVNDHLNALTYTVDHLKAENAGLTRVFETAAQLVASNDWSPARREQLALAVKECNNIPATAKAISDTEAAGMDIFRREVEKMVSEGVSDVHLPGINMCLGLVASLAFSHRITAGKRKA